MYIPGIAYMYMQYCCHKNMFCHSLQILHSSYKCHVPVENVFNNLTSQEKVYFNLFLPSCVQSSLLAVKFLGLSGTEKLPVNTFKSQDYE